MKKTIAFTAVALAIVSTNLTAKGLLGEQYFGVSYDIGSVENLDLWGVSFQYNKQLGSDNEYAYDLHVSASYAEFDDYGINVDGKDLDIGIVIYPLKEFELKPFISASAGYGEASLLGYSDDSFKYQISIGGEWKPSENLTVVPYWNYFDYTSLDDGGEDVFGIEASVWLKEKHNLGIDFSRMSSDGYDLDIVSVIYRRSF